MPLSPGGKGLNTDQLYLPNPLRTHSFWAYSSTLINPPSLKRWITHTFSVLALRWWNKLPQLQLNPWCTHCCFTKSLYYSDYSLAGFSHNGILRPWPIYTSMRICFGWRLWCTPVSRSRLGGSAECFMAGIHGAIFGRPRWTMTNVKEMWRYLWSWLQNGGALEEKFKDSCCHCLVTKDSLG